MEITLETRTEGDTDPGCHGPLAELFRTAINPRQFPGRRSWAGARPEYRIIARIDDVIVGHLGVLMKDILVDGVPHRAGQVGLQAVDPRCTGFGITGRTQLAAAALLRELGAAFGFANVGETRVPGFTGHGWIHVDRAETRLFVASSPFRTRRLRYPIVVLPITLPAERLLGAALFDINGFEL
jgi:nodulation protein A